MTREFLRILGVAACSLLLAIPVAAATKAPPKTPAKAAPARTGRCSWRAETLTGTIEMVALRAEPVLVVKGPDGVPFDMLVSRATRIEAGSHRITLGQLQSDTGKSVSVHFLPERSGDVARSVQVTG